LYEYLSDKLERNDNRGIAKEQLKFNFKSSVPSTDNKKLNRCPHIFVSGNKENIKANYSMIYWIIQINLL
jgi:hypothetical protein